MTARGAASEQLLVRQTMLDAGGYWRPLAALARLLEELGELSEILDAPASEEQLAGELADLWIITTALADQFLAEVAAPGEGGEQRPREDAEQQPSLAALLAAAGPVARVVNHYDGPKVPRAGAPMPSLHDAIAGFQEVLAALARSRGLDLAAAVRVKIGQIRARGDIERFARDGFDPSTAAVLREARDAALGERLWGAPEAPALTSAAGRARLARASLVMFAKAARAERLEAFVIAGPPPIAAAGRAAWLGALVAELDPLGGAREFELAGTALRGEAIALPARTLALIGPA